MEKNQWDIRFEKSLLSINTNNNYYGTAHICPHNEKNATAV